MLLQRKWLYANRIKVNRSGHRFLHGAETRESLPESYLHSAATIYNSVKRDG